MDEHEHSAGSREPVVELGEHGRARAGACAGEVGAQQLRPALGPWAAFSLVSGSMLGIGIFVAPPVVAAHLHSPWWFLVLWLAGGLSALFGALSVAELGAMLPSQGGDYTYLRLAYGRGFAFAAGWLQLLAVFPGSLATMAVGTATFQLPMLLGVEAANAPWWAALVIVALTMLNHMGVVLSGRVQLAITVVPIAVLFVTSLHVLWGTGIGELYAGAATTTPARVANVPGAASLAAAFLPVYFAYSGWNAAIFVGGEIARPERNLPLSLVGGTLVVTVLYLVLCAGFLTVFSVDDLAQVGEAGTAVARRLFGTQGERVVTWMIFLAMLSSINGTIMTGSRIAYAMAQQGDCVRAAGTLDSRFGTPVLALWLQAGWTIVLVFTQGFESLLSYASSAMLLTGTLAVLAVIVLRRKLPDRPRPYLTPGYPIAPLVYGGTTTIVLATLVWQAVASGDAGNAVFIGIASFVIALGIHRIWRART